MRFLLRMTFWLGLILVLLPGAGSQSTPEIPISATDAMSAAKATVTDMGRFCDRQPEACVVGSQAAAVIGQRAQAGARKLYELLNERHAPNESDSVATASSTAGGKAVPLPTPRPAQHTLTPTDVAPAWRGPPAGKEPRGEPAG
jgi:uncharacterized protein DUF5330